MSNSSIQRVLLGTLAALLLLAGASLAAGKNTASPEPRVLVAPIEGAIDPVANEFVKRLVERAEDEDFDALILEMDTPGGLSTSMDEIVQEIINADDLPVVVYVAPDGARAGSAGAFITIASDLAAMAPGTTIGSATPIDSQGGSLSGDLRKKVINDAASKMRVLAKERGRNSDVAEAFVREAENLTVDQAIDRNVVEYKASDLDDLLDQIDGVTVQPKGLEVTLVDAAVTRAELPRTLALLKLLIDPNLLFLLFSAGLIGLAFELTHPGAIFPGVAGAICLLMALFGLQVLPLSTAGILFLLLAAALFAAEAFVVSGGVLGAGGVLCLFLGGLLLFENGSEYEISLWLLIVVSLSVGGMLAFLVRKVVEARHEHVSTGAEFLEGKLGAVRRALTPQGTVYVEGELWKARTVDGAHVDSGSSVRIDRVDGLELVVEPVENGSAVSAGSDTERN